MKSKIPSMTKNGFWIVEEGADDIILYQRVNDNEVIQVLLISIPEMATQWNTKLP